jgi:hypothetical protein
VTSLGATQLLTARLRELSAEPLVLSVYRFMLNASVTAGLGVAFWVATARSYEAD